MKRGSRRTNWALKSQFDDVLQKLQALQSDGGERSAYITERKESTRAILKVLVCFSCDEFSEY